MEFADLPTAAQVALVVLVVVQAGLLVAALVVLARTPAERLTLPHPRAHERGFVLVPWLDADPGASLRVDDEVIEVSSILESVDSSGVRAAAAGDPGEALDNTTGSCGCGGC